MKSLLLAFLCLGFGAKAHAALAIPTSLSPGEQLLVLQTLGFGTSFRPVNNPYPLGGYSGVEIGISAHSVSTGDIGYYGSHAQVDNYTIYPLLNIGKGIFDNVDILFSFLPFNEGTGLGIYGGGVRWSFYQPTFVPASFSLLVSGSNSNFNNQFFSQTLGADLITSVNVDPFAFYFGAGTLNGQGRFAGLITSTNAPTTQTAQAFHTIIGMSVAVGDVFAAGEVDTYNATVVSFKLGLRL